MTSQVTNSLRLPLVFWTATPKRRPRTSHLRVCRAPLTPRLSAAAAAVRLLSAAAAALPGRIVASTTSGSTHVGRTCTASDSTASCWWARYRWRRQLRPRRRHRRRSRHPNQRVAAAMAAAVMVMVVVVVLTAMTRFWARAHGTPSGLT